MPSTQITELVFCCPNCGADLRASRRESGTVLDCIHCGERIHVPHGPHPVEAPAAKPLPSPREVLDEAARGCRLLLVSVNLLLIEYALIAAAYLFWLQTDGPAAIMRRQTETLYPLLITIWSLEALLVLSRTACRWWGLTQLESLATQVAHGGWLQAARYGTLLRLVGFGLMIWPWFAHLTWPLEGLAATLVKLGQFAWTVGVGLEFCALIPWYRLLRKFDGEATARTVSLYGVANIVGVLLGTVCMSILGMVIVMQVRAMGGMNPDRDGRVNPFEVPRGAWMLAGVFLACVALYWLVLMIWQRRILQRLLFAIRMEQLMRIEPGSLE